MNQGDINHEFTADNPANIKKAMEFNKNILIRGIKGVGKITNTMMAVRENPNVYYIGNPVDFEGRKRPVSYEKYLQYINSLKSDLVLVSDIGPLLQTDEKIILIIDEIYGRTSEQMDQIGALFDKVNIQVVQIVGCMKYMGSLIEKMDIIIDLHHDGAFTVAKDLARAICRVLGEKEQSLFS